MSNILNNTLQQQQEQEQQVLVRGTPRLAKDSRSQPLGEACSKGSCQAPGHLSRPGTVSYQLNRGTTLGEGVRDAVRAYRLRKMVGWDIKTWSVSEQAFRQQYRDSVP